MKKRLGVIAINKAEFEPYKASFPECHFHFSKNMIEFIQLVGSQKIDLIVFLEAPELIKSIKYLRGKTQFSKTPFLILYKNDNFTLASPHKDTFLKAYKMDNDLFMNILDFLGQLEDPKSFEKAFTIESSNLETAFINAIKSKMGQAQDFIARPATDDEMHSSFYCQQSAEISTHLFWVKYNARILQEGNLAFTEMFKNFSDQEKEEMSEQMLSLVMSNFQAELKKPLQKSGAVPFPPSDELEFAERKDFVKTAKNTALVFESSTSRWVLEMTQYI